MAGKIATLETVEHQKEIKVVFGISHEEIKGQGSATRIRRTKENKRDLGLRCLRGDSSHGDLRQPRGEVSMGT